MRILIVSATEPEVAPLKTEVERLNLEHGREAFNAKYHINNQTNTYIKHPEISFLVTGVGMVAMAVCLGKHLALNQYDLAINLGIAGSFDRSITIGEVVEVTTDTLSELGAEDDEVFLPIEELGFNPGYYQSRVSYSNYVNKQVLKKVTAITVNTVHGNEASIKKVVDRLNPQLESMEGAAFFYACEEYVLPCLQIRSVSNYVEKRNRANWDIPLAIKNLNNFAIEMVKSIDLA
jgi:futalosine hydrolase